MLAVIRQRCLLPKTDSIAIRIPLRLPGGLFWVLEEKAHILVDDALEAFQELAAYYLEKTGVDVIAVTGSNGKTTTKDMIHDILATTYRT